MPDAEEALTVLFCLVDDAYRGLSPRWRSHEPLKKLSDTEVLTSALFRQLWGCRVGALVPARRGAVLHLFPGLVGLTPSSFHRRLRGLRRLFEPLRCSVLQELVGDPETLIVDSTLLPVLHPRRVAQSAGSAGARWVRRGSFAVYGVKLRLSCATNRAPVSYELTPANAAEVGPAGELPAGVGLGDGAARRLLGGPAYRGGGL